MLRAPAAFLAAALFLATATTPESKSVLNAERASPDDLELGGQLAGTPAGATRYIRYKDLLRLPLETHIVDDDTNFPRGTRITGVALDVLASRFAKYPDETLIVAICDDKYRSNFPRDYRAAHHPLLVLRINGKSRDGWPKSEYGGSLGPYLISHPFFKPSFKVLSHDDEPQIPFGVLRIEFRREPVVFGAILPPGNPPPGSPIAQGFIIARQDCFRCHNSGEEGGTMAGSSWQQLGTMAQDNPRRFRAIIRNPKSVSPNAKMPGQPGYDGATLDALTAYFKPFAKAAPSSEKKANP